VAPAVRKKLAIIRRQAAVARSCIVRSRTQTMEFFFIYIHWMGSCVGLGLESKPDISVVQPVVQLLYRLSYHGSRIHHVPKTKLIFYNNHIVVHGHHMRNRRNCAFELHSQHKNSVA
jgi:hypothetical protein